MSQIKHNLISF